MASAALGLALFGGVGGGRRRQPRQRARPHRPVSERVDAAVPALAAARRGVARVGGGRAVAGGRGRKDLNSERRRPTARA